MSQVRSSSAEGLEREGSLSEVQLLWRKTKDLAAALRAGKSVKEAAKLLNLKESQVLAIFKSALWIAQSQKISERSEGGRAQEKSVSERSPAASSFSSSPARTPLFSLDPKLE